MDTLESLAAEHLRLRLQPINRALRAAALRQDRLAARLEHPEAAELCVTTQHVVTLLDDVTSWDHCVPDDVEGAALVDDELELEEALRARAAAVGTMLPLDRLGLVLGLRPVECEAIVLCAAPEVDRNYERIYAYVLDDLQRRAACVELIASLTASSIEERFARRRMFGRLGRLQRCGVLRSSGEATTEWRQELRLTPLALEMLLGLTEAAHFVDPAVVDDRDPIHTPADLAERIERLGGALDLELVQMIGVWGPRNVGHREVARAIAAAARHPLRRLILPASPEIDPDPAIRDAIEVAGATGAILWIATDRLMAPAHERTRDALAERLAACGVRVIASGTQAWRPSELLAVRPYAELELARPSFDARVALWREIVPELGAEAVETYAARFRLEATDLRAVAALARAARHTGADEADLEHQVSAACLTVTRRTGDGLARSIVPERGPEDLVLPRELHDQVVEIGQFFQAWPRVSEQWGLGRALAGTRGVKALFTGDPGTGKTLAAEVTARMVGLRLMKVDLAQVVSKWVGETEKNLEVVFREAEESHSVLFFDEADALFGKRGEVQHGTDRYANLEVSYLLQRLEDYDGLLILASNLKDNIDNAFTRRFHVVIHFPRPREEERRRIWCNALPAGAPVDASVDIDQLARIDLTGAGIVNSVRTAALLAAGTTPSVIHIDHVLEGISRQFRREARVFSVSEYGPRRAALRGA